MASSQPQSLLGRARPSRPPPKPVLQLKTTASVAPPHVSNVSLFLTNLRLLDLDHLPDWPDINALTFTNKDLAQGQKKRIQSVEWALYQLFDLWDAEETRNKLNPFFPPLDQVQSLNLRAALLRCLEQAKKNGALGRDAVVRRTMLDECKGERLEEVLAVFSSAVLKKLVAEAGPRTIAQAMALEQRGYAGDTVQITALMLAHRASLLRLLREKRHARERYNHLAQLLILKERQIARRREKLRGQEGVRVSEHEKLDVWRAVRNNWAGNDRWMETLLYGEMPRNGILTASFDRVWRRTETGRLTELDEAEAGLLIQLDQRINLQRERLLKWQAFRRETFGTDPMQDRAQKRKSVTHTQAKQQGIDLGFRAHENIRPEGASLRKLAGPRLRPEYAALVQDLDVELRSINMGDANPFDSGLFRTTLRNSGSLETDEISVVDNESCPVKPSETTPPPDDQLQLHAQGRVPSGSQLRESEGSQEARVAPDTTVAPRPRSLILNKTTNLPASSRLARPRLPAPTQIVQPPAASKHPDPRTPSPPARYDPADSAPESQTQQLADAILASISAASPSPEKKRRHTLSLAERTRLSMARGPQPKEEDADRLTLQRRGTNGRRPTVIEKECTIKEEDDLVARTQRSMANFEATRQRAQLERQRSQRKAARESAAHQHRRNGGGSIAITSVEEAGDVEDSVLVDEMLQQGIDDYESIFKSRPRIKASPPQSPM